MATEKQIAALEKWLQVDLEDMDFNTCSDYLDRLHTASEEYNADPQRLKGIVKKEKESILAELRKANKISRPAGEQKITPEEDEPNVERGTVPIPASDDQRDRDEANAEIVQMGTIMQFCVAEAQRIVNDLANGGVTEGTKAGLIQKLSTTMFIEAMKRGLLK